MSLAERLDHYRKLKAGSVAAPAVQDESGYGQRGAERRSFADLTRAAVEAGEAKDPQRSANLFERVASAAMLPTSIQVGAIRAATAPPGRRLEAGLRSIAERETFGPLMADAVPEAIKNVPVLPVGPPGTPARVSPEQAAGALGLAPDIVLNPLTYTSVGGLTKAGVAARSNAVAQRVAALGGSQAPNTGLAPIAGRFGSTMGEQARAGHRALVSFAGRPVVRGAEVFEVVGDASRKVAQTRIGEAVYKNLSQTFSRTPGLAGVESEALLGRAKKPEVAARVHLRRVAKDLGDKYAEGFKKLRDKLGVTDDEMWPAVSDAIERSKANVGKLDLSDFMDPDTQARYRRWVYQANAERVRIGNARSASRPNQAADPPIGPLARPNIGDPTAATAGEMGFLGRGRKGAGPANARTLASQSDKRALGERNMRGNEPSRSIAMNPFQTEGSWGGGGPMPDELLAFLPENTRRAVRRAEAQALGESGIRATNEAIEAAANRFGPAAPEFVNDKSLRAFIADVNLRNAANLARERGMGIKISEVSGALNYLAHVSTRELRDAFQRHAPEMRGLSAREFTEKMAHQIQRKFGDKTLAEINDIARTAGLDIGGTKVKFPNGAFEPNPLVAQTVRDAASAGAVADAQFLRDVVTAVGLPSAKAPKNWRVVSSGLDDIADIAVPPEYHGFLTRHLASNRASGEVGRIYDEVTQWWKANTLALWPVFHTRNQTDDLYRMVAYGDFNLDILPQMTREALHGTPFAAAVPVPAGPTVVGGRRFSPGAFRAFAEDYGAIDAAQYVGELGDEVMRLPAKKSFNPLNRNNMAIRAGLAFGSARENANRLALFADRMNKGDTPEQAALWVDKILFNYGGLTERERAIKRALPFFTYTRFNAPLTLEYLAKRPRALVAVQSAREEASGNQLSPAPEVANREFLAQGAPIRTGTSPEGAPEYSRLAGQLGITDISLLEPSEAAARTLGLVNPFIQTPVEVMSNLDFFRSRPTRHVPLERFPGETENLLGFQVPRRTVGEMLELYRPIMELNRLNPGNIFGTADEPGIFGHTRDFPEPSMAARLANLFVGRTYAVDPDLEEERQGREAAIEISRLKSLLARAEREGREGDAERLERMIENLEDKPWLVRSP